MRGRRVRTPKTAARPSQDRLREALFNMLGDRVGGSRFLDLFAGSGSVGIEAWSRGADWVTWVESDRVALACLRENRRCLCEDAGEVVAREVGRFLAGREKKLATDAYDIIFADPPYREQGWTRRLAPALARGYLLRAGGIWVLEAAHAAEDALSGWRLRDERRYGGARLHFYEKNEKGGL